MIWILAIGFQQKDAPTRAMLRGGIVSQASFKTENTPARTPLASARARAIWWA